MPNGIAIRPEALGERLVDDGDWQAGIAVRPIEVAAAQ